ncbi:Iota-carrageenase A2 [Neolewinella aurantiaca]|uniref:Iota-carrageenase A2 n=1 Tax=Neolewinella aurantiaca TaxID=2602767 RepID=A0A5C7FH86_9BACT|nr:Iota-carrageenase A2 [Neolewinella aurantiaca]TXF86677.1 Iota-carrageenase A2 [Neolewinella aurantiaca]
MARSYFTLLLIFVALGLCAQTESDFYQDNSTELTIHKNLQVDYSVDGKGSPSDSKMLQRAIDQVAAKGGGIITLTAGTYHLHNIELRSNVHLRIDKDVVIEHLTQNPKKSEDVFILAKNGAPIENVSITGIDGVYTINLEAHPRGVRAFNVGAATNFMIADFLVKDQRSMFSCVTLGISTTDDVNYVRPKNGVIKNGNCLNTLYGYGLVQMQAGENILYQNLKGQGGVTLRAETGLTKMNDLQFGGVDKIVARNISCTDGNAAVMISPHAMKCGSIDVDGVTAINCGFGVRIGGGFVSKKYKNPDLEPGSFEKVDVKNVTATFGETAQLKGKHLKYLPVYREKMLASVPQKGSEVVSGPSIAAVLYEASHYRKNVTISNVRGIGFLCQKDIIEPTDKHSTMDCE